MPTTSILKNCLADLGRAFGDQRWCLIGAQAAILYGSTRMTQDIDVSLMLAPSLWPEMLAALNGIGFESRIDTPLEFAARSRVLLLRHVSSQIPVDIVLAGPGLEDLFLDRVRQINALDLALPVIAPEDLIASKLLAGRPRDIEDVTAIIRRYESLNRKQVQETLSLLEQALDRSDLLPFFHRLIDAARMR